MKTPNLQKKQQLEEKKFKKIWETQIKVVMKNIMMTKQKRRNKQKKKNLNICPTNQKIQILNLKLLSMQIPIAKLGKTDKEYYLLAKEVSMVDIDI